MKTEKEKLNEIEDKRPLTEREGYLLLRDFPAQSRCRYEQNGWNHPADCCPAPRFY